MELGLLVYRRRESQDLLEPFSRRMTAPREARLEEHACKTSAHAQGLYFQIGGCECELHNKNASF